MLISHNIVLQNYYIVYFIGRDWDVRLNVIEFWDGILEYLILIVIE